MCGGVLVCVVGCLCVWWGVGVGCGGVLVCVVGCWCGMWDVVGCWCVWWGVGVGCGGVLVWDVGCEVVVGWRGEVLDVVYEVVVG